MKHAIDRAKPCATRHMPAGCGNYWVQNVDALVVTSVQHSYRTPELEPQQWETFSHFQLESLLYGDRFAAAPVIACILF